MHDDRLPSLAGLLALEAVARHGTVSRAAEELGLSQPAVSRRLAALEADVGRALIDRRRRPVQLTAAGRELSESVALAVSRLREVAARLRGEPHSPLTISAGAGFSTYWLIPRLARMQRAFPSQALRIVSQSHDREADLTGDLQVRFGELNALAPTDVPLVGERAFPVASPALRARLPANPSPAQLARWPLLDLRVTRQPWFDWGTWWSAVGFRAPKSATPVQFDSYPLVVAAALAGQGLCLCWSGLLEPFLESGALVRVGEWEATSTRGYFLSHAPHLPSGHRARQAADWIVAEFGRTERAAVTPPSSGESARQPPGLMR